MSEAVDHERMNRTKKYVHEEEEPFVRQLFLLI